MNKNKIVSLLIISALTVFAFNVSVTKTEAIGGFFKNKLKSKSTQETNQAVQNNETQEEKASEKPTSDEPVVYENTKYHYTIEYPGDWVLKNDDPKKNIVSMTDDWGKKASLSINSTWMSDNFPVAPAVKALEDQAKQRKKHGELESYELKNYAVPGKDGIMHDIVKGVLIIESDEDPDYKRMQWQAYGGGNYYNFVLNASVANFPEYREDFQKVIDSIKFDFSEGAYK